MRAAQRGAAPGHVPKSPGQARPGQAHPRIAEGRAVVWLGWNSLAGPRATHTRVSEMQTVLRPAVWCWEHREGSCRALTAAGGEPGRCFPAGVIVSRVVFLGRGVPCKEKCFPSPKFSASSSSAVPGLLFHFSWRKKYSRFPWFYF